MVFPHCHTSPSASWQSTTKKQKQPTTSDQKFHNYLSLIFGGIQLKGHFFRNTEHSDLKFKISETPRSENEKWNIKLIFWDVMLCIHSGHANRVPVNFSNFLLCKWKTKLIRAFSQRSTVFVLKKESCVYIKDTFYTFFILHCSNITLILTLQPQWFYTDVKIHNYTSH